MNQLQLMYLKNIRKWVLHTFSVQKHPLNEQIHIHTLCSNPIVAPVSEVTPHVSPQITGTHKSRRA